MRAVKLDGFAWRIRRAHSSPDIIVLDAKVENHSCTLVDCCFFKYELIWIVCWSQNWLLCDLTDHRPSRWASAAQPFRRVEPLLLVVKSASMAVWLEFENRFTQHGLHQNTFSQILLSILSLVVFFIEDDACQRRVDPVWPILEAFMHLATLHEEFVSVDRQHSQRHRMLQLKSQHSHLKELSLRLLSDVLLFFATAHPCFSSVHAALLQISISALFQRRLSFSKRIKVAHSPGRIHVPASIRVDICIDKDIGHLRILGKIKGLCTVSYDQLASLLMWKSRSLRGWLFS